MPFQIHHQEPFLPSLENDVGECECHVQYMNKSGEHMIVTVGCEYVRGTVVGSRIRKVTRNGKNVVFWSFNHKEQAKIRLYAVNAAQTMLSSRHLALREADTIETKTA